MSKQKMIGNLKTRDLIAFLESRNIDSNINLKALNDALLIEAFTFPGGNNIPFQKS